MPDCQCGHTHAPNTHTCGWRITDTDTCTCKGPKPTETENEVNAHQHIRIGLALLVEDREHWHSRADIAAFLTAELDHAFEEAA